jgi:hypothetical protein
MGPEQLAAYRAELAQFVQENEETIRGEQEKRREKVFDNKGYRISNCCNRGGRR